MMKFLQKQILAVNYFRKKDSITYVRVGSKYTLATSFEKNWLNFSGYVKV